MSREKQQVVKDYGSAVDHNYEEHHRKIMLHKPMYFSGRTSLDTAGWNFSASEEL